MQIMKRIKIDISNKEEIDKVKREILKLMIEKHKQINSINDLIKYPETYFYLDDLFKIIKKSFKINQKDFEQTIRDLVNEKRLFVS
jgi:hypothetical protein